MVYIFGVQHKATDEVSRLPTGRTHPNIDEFTAAATCQFLKDSGVHRLLSLAHPHSNCRAEIGVKTVKRLLTNNTNPHGGQCAILQYWNTSDAATKLSPAQCVFGRPIKNFIPLLPSRYIPHPTWSDTLAAREEALKNRHVKEVEQWTVHTRRLSPPAVRQHIRIQKRGPHPNKWDKTGIIEACQFDQHVVCVDGSGRITLRNGKFLRRYVPAIEHIFFNFCIDKGITSCCALFSKYYMY